MAHIRELQATLSVCASDLGPWGQEPISVALSFKQFQPPHPPPPPPPPPAPPPQARHARRRAPGGRAARGRGRGGKGPQAQLHRPAGSRTGLQARVLACLFPADQRKGCVVTGCRSSRLVLLSLAPSASLTPFHPHLFSLTLACRIAFQQGAPRVCHAASHERPAKVGPGAILVQRHPLCVGGGAKWTWPGPV